MFAHYSMEKDENVVLSILPILSNATMFPYHMILKLYVQYIFQELKEEFTRILTANNPHAPQNIVRYSFKVCSNQIFLCSQKGQYVVATLSILPPVSPSICQQLLTGFWRKFMGTFSTKKKCAYLWHVRI